MFKFLSKSLNTNPSVSQKLVSPETRFSSFSSRIVIYEYATI